MVFRFFVFIFFVKVYIILFLWIILFFFKVIIFKSIIVLINCFRIFVLKDIFGCFMWFLKYDNVVFMNVRMVMKVMRLIIILVINFIVFIVLMDIVFMMFCFFLRNKRIKWILIRDSSYFVYLLVRCIWLICVKENFYIWFLVLFFCWFWNLLILFLEMLVW